MEIIKSRQNQHIVKLGLLTMKKHREEQGLFRFEGWKLLVEAVKAQVTLDSIFLNVSCEEKIRSLVRSALNVELEALCSNLYLVDNDLFLKVSEEKTPDGIITIAKPLDKFQNNATIYILKERKHFLLLLDSVRDPSNLGAILRTAASLDVSMVILSSDCADLYSYKTIRASMGAVFTQPTLMVQTLSETVKELQGYGHRIYAAALNKEAKVLGQCELSCGDCVVIGNEGHGICDEVLSACDEKIFIPITDKVESMNASVASAILMWEFTKIQHP